MRIIRDFKERLSYYIYLFSTLIVIYFSNTFGFNENAIVIFSGAEGICTNYKDTKVSKLISIKQYICYLLYKSNVEYQTIRGCTGFTSIEYDGQSYSPILEYNLYSFIKKHKLTNLPIEINVYFGGIGGDSWVNDSIMFKVLGDKNHIGRPHIHIKKRDGSSVVAKIFDNDVVFEDKNIWKKKFVKKEKKLIKECIIQNKERFTDFYNKVTNGEDPGYFEFYYDGKICSLGYRGSIHYRTEYIWNNGI